jgi:hypothetical protein
MHTEALGNGEISRILGKAFHTKRSRGGVQRRQRELKGVEGGR